jgi:hypothetical protein
MKPTVKEYIKQGLGLLFIAVCIYLFTVCIFLL